MVKSGSERDQVQRRKESKLEAQRKIDALAQWMIDGGADVEKVEIRLNDKLDRGVFANCDIKSGETVLFVPKSLIIDTEKASANTISKKIIQNTALTERVGAQRPVLCAYILQARREMESTNHEFEAYIDSLPTDAKQYPLFYSE